MMIEEKKVKVIRISSLIVNLLIVVYFSFLHVSAISKVSNLLSLVFMFLICVILFLKKKRFFIPRNLFSRIFYIRCTFFALVSDSRKWRILACLQNSPFANDNDSVIV